MLCSRDVSHDILLQSSTQKRYEFYTTQLSVILVGIETNHLHHAEKLYNNRIMATIQEAIENINKSVRALFDQIKRKRNLEWERMFCVDCANVYYQDKDNIVIQKFTDCTCTQYSRFCGDCFNEHCTCDSW